MVRGSTVGFLVLLSSFALAGQGEHYALHNGDRVAWYGDSITDNSPYCVYAEAYTVLHYPNLNVRFYNAGVGGDRVTGGWMGPIDQRLTRDLFSRKPTVITSMLGMNDASYQKFDEGIFDTYKKGYQHMVDRFHAEAPNARVWLFRPSPFDVITHTEHAAWMNDANGYNDVLLKYADYVSDLAKANGYGVVDQNAPLNDVLYKAKPIPLAQQIIPDSIHPGWQGDMIMAEQVLKAWGAQPIVSTVAIDAAVGQAAPVNAKVTGVQKGNSPSWTETEASLPFPIARKDPLAALVLQCSDFDLALNQEILTVTGLSDGSYHLKIDGKDLGSFTSQQFAAGVNLAQLDTPMIEQAAKVLDLSQKRADLWYQRWRQLDFTLQDYPSSSLENAKKALDGEIEEIVKQQHLAAQPKPHKYEVVPA
ncbi:MAG TPA: SGNH/GDSL hydrolase family protein [Fimbriimonas sp.]|nr:SGNH/GDSL hydrolase family protein [Fimbriimonas sp.]